MIAYPNELVKSRANARKRNRLPVIAVVSGGRLMNVNGILIRDLAGTIVARVTYDPSVHPSPFHDVSAWVQIEEDSTQIDFF